MYITNLGTNGNVIVGNINTNAAVVGNSVFIVAHGTVSTGNINVSAPGGNVAGAVFLSSGQAVAGAVTTGTITGGAVFEPRGLWVPILPGATFVNTGIVGIPGGRQFIGTPAGATANIVGPATITMGNGTLTTFNPGGFDSINAPASTLTINQTGFNEFSLIPVRGGDVNLGALSYSANHVAIVMAAGDINIGGDITGTGDLRLFSSAGGFTADNITVTRGFFSLLTIHTSQNIVMPNGANWTATWAGNGGLIWLTSAGADINLGTAGNTTNNALVANGSSGGFINLFARNNINNYSVTINATATGGAGGSSTIHAIDGALNFYSLYNAGNHYNSNILFNSTAGAGGAVQLGGMNGGVNFLRDNTICCAGTTTAQINVTGTTSGGYIGITPSSTLNISEAITINASAANGTIKLLSVNDSTINANLNAPTAILVNRTPNATLTFGGTVTSSVSPSITSNGIVVINNTFSSSSGTINVTANTLMLGGAGQISAPSISLTTQAIINNGLITASTTGSPLTVNNVGNLTVGGTGIFRLTGGGANTLTLAIVDDSVLTLDGTFTLDPGTNDVVNVNAQSFGASIVFAANANIQIQTATGNAGVTTLSSPSIIFNGNSGVTTDTSAGAGITINSGGGASPLTIRLANSSTSTLTTAGGLINFTPTAGQALAFTKTAGAGTSTLNLNGAPVTITSSATVVVDPSTRVFSNNNMTLNINGGTLTNNGTLQTTLNNGSLQILSTSGLTIGGSGTFSATVGAARTITFSASGANTLSFVGSNSFSSALINFNAQNASGGAISFGDTTTQTVSGSLTISTPNLTFGSSSVITSGATINSGGGAADLTITLPDSSTATLSGTASSITPTAGRSLVFVKTAGAGTTSLNLAGSSSATVSGGAMITVNSSVTVSASTMTLTNNGGLVTVDGVVLGAAGCGGCPSIIIQGTDGITLSGSGILANAGGGGGTQTIVQLNGAGTINISGSFAFTYSGGGGGPSNQILATGGTLNVLAGANYTSNISTVINSPNIVLNNNASISSVNTSVTSSGAIVITTPDSGSATLAGTSSLSITPTAGQTLTFAKSAGAGSTTLNLNGTVNTTTSAATLVSPSVNLVGNGNMTFTANASTLTNNGSITSTLANGSITLTGAGLTLAGTGSISQTGGGAGADVTITATGANTLTLTGTQAFSAGASGTIDFNATNASGHINFAAGMNYSVANGSAITVDTPNLDFGNLAQINASGASTVTFSAGGANPRVVTMPDSSSATVSTTGGSINFTGNSTQALTFSKTAGVGTATLNLNGGLVTTTSTAGTTIDANVILQTDNSVVMNSNGVNITNNGIVRTSAVAGSILLQGNNGFGLMGTGSYDFTGGGATSMTVQLNGAGTLNLNSDITFSPGDAGSVNFNATNASGIISVGANADITAAGGADLVVSTPSLTFAGNATLNTSGDGTISLNSGGGASPLTITSPDGSSASIITAGGAINIVPTAGRNLIFAKSTGVGVTTLNLNGGPVSTMTSGAGATTINASVTLATNNSIGFTNDGQLFTNNGAVTTSQAAGSITVQGTSGFGLAGAGSYNFTGGGATAMTVQLNGAGTLSIGADTTFSPGDAGSVNINATAGTVSLGANVDITAAGGANLVLSSPNLTFGATSSLNVSGNGTVTVNSGGASTLTVTVQNNSSALVGTAGGAVNFTPTAGQNLVFAKTAGGSTATLNINGGSFNTTTSGAGTTTVNASVILQSNNNIVMTSNGQLVTNNGTVRTTMAAGAITLQGTNGFGLAGVGSYDFTGGGATAMTVQLNGAGTLNLNADVTFSPGDSGTVNINAASGTISIGANADITAAGGADLVVSSPGLTFGDTSSINVSGNGTILINSGGGANPLTITAPTGSSATISSQFGLVAISPTAGQSLTFAQSGVGSSTLNISGGMLTTSTSSAGTSINNGVTVSSVNSIDMTVNGALFTNNGTLTTAGSTIIQGTNGFGLTGSGAVTFSGGGAHALTIQLNGAGILTLSTSTFNISSGSGAVNLYAQDPSAQISIGSSVVTVSGGAGVNFNVRTPSLILGNNGQLVGSGYLGIDSSGIAADLTITGPSGGSASLSGSNIFIAPASGRTLTFSQSASGGTTINLINPSGVTISANAAVTADSGVTLSANGNIAATVDGALFTNNGLLTTSRNNGLIILQGSSGFGLAGSGDISFTGAGGKNLTIQLNGAGTLNIASNTFTVGTGNVNINAQNAAGQIDIGGNTFTINGSSTFLHLSSPTLTFGDGGAFVNNAGSIDINAGGAAADMTITAPSGGNANLTGTAIVITPTAGRSLVFAKTAGVSSATLNVNGGTLSTTTSGAGTTTINSNVILQSNNNVDMISNGQLLTNNGVVRTTMVAGAITVEGTNGFGLAGTGSYDFTGGGASAMTVRLNGAGTLSLSSDATFSPGDPGTVNINAASGAIALGANVDITAAGGADLVISSPGLAFGDNSTLNVSGNGSVLVNTGGASALTVTVMDNTSAAINTGGGVVNFTPTAGQNLVFAKTAGGNNGTLNVNGGALNTTTSGAGTTTVNASVVLQSNNSIDMTSNGQLLTNNGMVRTTMAAGAITLQGTNGFGLAGTGSYDFTGGGATSMTVQLNGAGTLSLSSDVTFSPGDPGAVNISAASGAIALGANVDITAAGGADLVVSTPGLTFGDNSTLNVSGNGTLLINSGGGANDLTVTMTDNTSAAITTAGGAVSFTPTAGQSLVFAKTAGGNTGTLNVNGGALNTTTSGAGTTTVNASVVIQSNNNIDMISDGQLFTNNGTIRTTAAGGAITVEGTNGFGLAGNGSYDFTGGGATTMTVQLNGAGTLNLSSDTTFSPGDPGLVVISAFDVAGFISLGDNVDITAAGGANLHVRSPNLVFGNASSLNTSGNGTISINSGIFAAPLSITTNDGSSASVNTAGGLIFINSLPGQNMLFTKTAGASTSTLLFTGGIVQPGVSAPGTITVDAGVILQSDNDITFTANGSVFTNNGIIRTSRTGGIITLQGTNGFGFAGTGSYEFTGGGVTSMLVQLTGAGTLSINNDVTFSPGDPGQVIIGATDAAGFISLGANVDITAGGGANLQIRTPNLILGSNSSLNASGNGTISIISFSANPLTITTNDGSSASINTAGGLIFISPTVAGHSLLFTKTVGASTSTLFFTGGIVQPGVSAPGTITVDAGVILQSDNNMTFTSNGSVFTNNGIIRTSRTGGIITLQGTNGFGFAGTGSYEFTGGGSTVMSIQLTGAGTLNLNDDLTLSPGDSGRVEIMAFDAAASIVLGSNVDITAAGGANLQIRSPNIVFSNGSSLNVSGDGTISLNSGIFATPLTITTNDGSSASVNTAGGSIFINSLAGQNMLFTKTAGASTSTLFFTGGLVNPAVSAGGTITVDAGVILQADNNMTFTSNGSVLTNNGIVRTTRAAGTITLQGTNGFGIAGTGSYEFTGGGVTSMIVQLNGAGTLNINNDVTFSPGDPGQVIIGATDAAGFISLGANVDITAGGGANLQIRTPNLILGNNSSLNTSGDGTISITTFSANPLTITTNDGSSASVNTSGGQINITPTTAGQNILFTKTAGASTSTLFFTGGLVNPSVSAGGTITVDTGVILQADNNMTFTSNGSAITNNGVIRTTMAGGAILLQGTSGFGVTGTGSYEFTGGGATSMTVQLNGAGILSLGSDTTFSPGDSGAVNINAIAGTIALGANVDITAAGGADLVVSSPGLTFGGASTLNVAGNGTVSFNSGGSSALTLTGPAGASTSVNTAGGAISITPTAGQSLTFATAGGNSTINFNGGPITTTTTVDTIVQANVTVASNNAIVMNVNGGTLQNNGTITSMRTGVAGSVTVQSTGNLTINPSGVITAGTAGGGNGGTLNFLANSGTLTLNPGSYSSNASGAGNADGGAVNISAQTLAVGGALSLSANAVGTGNGGTLSVTISGATGDINVGAGTLSLSATGGSGASASGNGGTITLNAGRNLTVDPASINIGPQGTNGDGGIINLTAGSAASGLLQVNGALSVNGAGSGNGGSVNITYNDATNPLVVGAAGANSYVNGAINVNAPAGGNGGNISISNSAAAALNVTLTGNISAGSASGTLGAISFLKPGQDVSVTGAGALVGAVNASGAVVTLDPQAAGVTLTTGNILATSDLSISANGAGSQIIIPLGSVVNLNDTAFSILDIRSNALTVNGSLTSSGNIVAQRVGAGDFTLSGNGTITHSSTYQTNLNTGNTLFINGSLTFNSNGAQVRFQSQGAGGRISLGAGVTITMNNPNSLVTSTELLDFGAGSGFSTAANANFIMSSAGTVHQIRTATGSSATLTTGGSVQISSGFLDINFTQTGAGSSTLNLNASSVTVNNPVNNISIASGVTLASSNNILFTPTAGTFTNNGTVQVASAGGTITVSDPGSLIIAGNGIYSLTGGGAGLITFSAGGANPLTISGSSVFNPGAAGTVNFNAQSTGGSVVFNASTTQTVNNAGIIQLSSPTVVLGALAQITASGASTYNFNSGGGANGLTIRGTDSSSAIFTTAAGGAFSIVPTVGQTLTFDKTAGAGTTTINFNGANLTTQTSVATAINSGVIVSSNQNINMTVNGTTLVNNGTLQSTLAGGTILLQGTNGFGTSGTGSINFTAVGANTLTLQLNGAGTLNIGAQTVDLNSATGTLNLNAQDVAGVINFGANTLTVSNGANVVVSTPSLQFGNNGAINATGASVISLNSGGGAVGLIIQAQTGSAATIATTGGSINILPTAGQTLTFAQSGAGIATINLNGGTVTMTTAGATTTINSGVTVLSNNNFNITSNGANFVNNGTLRTTQNAGAIVIQGSAGFGLTGNGAISFAQAGVANTLTVQLNGAGTLNIGAQTIDLNSATGTVNLNAQDVAGVINLGANTLTVSNGASVIVSTPSLQFGNNGTISATGASVISLNSGGGAVGLTIQAQTGSAATISTTGGSIAIVPTAGQSLTFAQSGAGVATINLNGGAVTMTTAGATTTVNAGVTVSSNNSYNITVNGANFVNNGILRTTQSAGIITIAGTNGFGLSGTGAISYTQAGVANVLTIQLNGAGTLNLGNQTFDVNSATGTVNLNAQDLAGAINLGANTVTVSNGANLVVSTPSLTFGNGGAINATGASVISVNSGGGAVGLTITAPTGAAASISTTGGTINIAPTAGQALTFAQSGAGSTTLSMGGGTINLTALTTLTVSDGVSVLATGGSGLISSTATTVIGVGATLGGTADVTINTDTLTANGTITTNGVGAVLRFVGSAGADLVMQGSPVNISTTGAGSQIQVNQNNVGRNININTDYSFNAGAGNTIQINATSQLNIANGRTLTIAGGSNLFSAATTTNIAANAVIQGSGDLSVTTTTFNNNGTVTTNGAGSVLRIIGNVGANLILQGNSLGVTTTGLGSQIQVNQNSVGQGVVFNSAYTFNAGNGNTVQFNANNGIAISDGIAVNIAGNSNLFTGSASVNVGNGSSLSGSGNVNITASTLSNSGSIATTLANGQLLLSSAAGLTVSGSGSLTANNGNSIISFTANGANTLAINGNQTIDAGANGTTNFNAVDPAGVISFGATPVISSGGAVNISSPNVSFLASGGLNSTGNSTITFAPGTAANLVVTLADNVFATVATGAGGAINVNAAAGQSVNFVKAVGPNFSSLSLNGAPVTISSDTGISNASNALVISNNNMTVNANAGAAVNINADFRAANLIFNLNGGTLTNNSNISATQAAGSINIQSTSGLTLAGSGNIAVTGGGAGTVLIAASNGAANAVNINGSVNLSAGGSGTITINSQNAGGSVSIGGGAALIVTTGEALTVSSPNLIFAGNNAAMNLGASTLNINPAGANDLTLTAPDSGSAFITMGAAGVLNIQPAAGHQLIFAKTAGGGNGTLNIGGPATATITTDTGITVNLDVVVAMNINTTFNVNNGVFTNSGVITSNVVGGNFTIQSTGDLTIAGVGSIGHNAGGASSVIIQSDAGSASTLTFAGGLFVGGLNNQATVTIRSLNAGGQIAFNANTGVIVQGDAALVVNSPTINFNGNNSTITATGATNMTIAPGSAATLNINAPDSGVSTISTGAGGTVNVVVPVGQSLVFGKSAGAGIATLNLDSVPVVLTTTNADTVIQGSVIVSSNNNLTFNVNNATFNNAGTARTTLGGGTLTVQGSTGDLTINGAGTLSGTNLRFISSSGFVNASQANITGTLGGSAATSFTTNATGSGLAVTNITANNGTMSLTAGGGILNATAGANLTSTQNMTLTGQTGVTFGAAAGAAVTAAAGVVAGNPFSTDMSDYNYAAITSPASVMVVSNTGDINVNDNVTLTARGNSVGLTSANDINVGSGNVFFAQGGNVWFDAANNFAAPAGTNAQLTSVARTTAGTVVIDGITVPAFNGGGIAIYAGNPGQPLDAILNAAQLNRTAAGTTVIDPGVNVTGTTITNTNGSTINLLAPGAGKIGAINSNFNIQGGVFIVDPPGDQIDINNMTVTISGQGLTPPPPPPTPSSGSPTVTLDSTPVLSDHLTASDTGSSSSVILTTDSTMMVNTDEPEDYGKSGKKNNNSDYLNQQIAVDPSNRYFVVAQGPCQPFLFTNDQDDSAMIGEGGSMFAMLAPNQLQLKQGKIIAVSGKSNLIVKTVNGEVLVPPESATIVQSDGKYTRVAGLDGQPAKFKLDPQLASQTQNTMPGNGADKSADAKSQSNHLSGIASSGQSAMTNNLLEACPGEEIIIADSSLAEEELIPVDGVDRSTVIDGAIIAPGTKASKNRFDMKEMAFRDNLLLCNIGGHRLRFDKRMAGIKQRMEQERSIGNSPAQTAPKATKPLTKAALPNGSIVDKNDLQQISFLNSGANKVSASGVMTIDSEFGMTKHSHKSRVYVASPNSINLGHGDTLVAPNKTTFVRAGLYMVQIEPGAIVLISKKDEITKVSNLWENHSGSIKVYHDKQFATIRCGQEVILAPSSTQVSNAILDDSTGRRRPKTYDFSTGHTLLRSEVSIVSLLQNNEVLNRMLQSDSAQDQELCEKLIKMAACLSHVTGSHGAYSSAAK